MHKPIIIAALILELSGCAGSAGLLSNPGALSGEAAGLFGVPAATVSTQMQAEIMQISQVAQQLQMLRAQLNGTPVMPPPLPSPGSVP